MVNERLTEEEVDLIAGEGGKNRAQRRARRVNRLFTRKGYYEYLNAIKITRKKNGKTKHKYVLIDRKGV